MKIRNLLILVALLFTMALLAISILSAAVDRQIDRLKEQKELANDIAFKGAGLAYPWTSYLVYRSSQQIELWESQYSSIADDMEDLDLGRPDRQALLRDIEATYKQLGETWSDMLSEAGSLPETGQDTIDLASIQAAWSKMQAQSQEISSDASRLAQGLQSQIDRLEQMDDRLVYALVLVAVVFLLAHGLVFYRRILKPISSFQRGARAIDSGNLDFFIREERKDEIGDLTRAFNWMTANLRKVTASKSALEKEMAERRRVEEQLRQLAERLSILHKTGEGILSARSAEEVAEMSLQYMSHLLPYRLAGVVLLDQVREATLLAIHSTAETKLGKGRHWPLGEVWAQMAPTLARGDSYVVEDLQEVSPSSPIVQDLQAEGIRAIVLEPLLAHDQLIGVLGVGMPLPGSPPSEQMDAVRELAGALAIGLEQARLHEEVERHAGELELVVRQRTHELLVRTKALEASEARFRTIFEEAAVGIALADLSGRLVAANPALQRLVGYNEQDLTGMRGLDFLTAPNTECGERFPELLAGQRSAYTVGQRYVRQDGGTGEANVTVSLLHPGEADEPLLVLALVEDVTERKRAQEALIQAERLAIMGRMAASLAHEINNPIQAVVGSLELATELLEEGEDASPYMEVATEELERASRIVRQMRDLSLREEHRKEPTDMGEMMERVLLLTRKQAQNRHVEVFWEPEGDLPLLPMVRDRIQQVFLNLILNAIDAMPQGGALRIQAARTVEPPGVQVFFADTGVGIPPDQVKRLFEAFHSTKELGLGLGLYVSRNIIQEHGGWIDVQSQVGIGTTFTVWLPAGSE